METSDLLDLLEDLTDDIDSLEDHLTPLLSTPLSANTKKLPLLDRAKLYTLLVYAIESLLFSYLRLHGKPAKSHAVYTELTRVKAYFAKIASAESDQTPVKPTLSLNKQATGRFIKAALAGNDKFDTERAEREAREKLLAARKLREVQSRLAAESVSVSASTSPEPKKKDDDDMEDGELEDSEILDAPVDEPNSSSVHPNPLQKSAKQKRAEAKANGTYVSKKQKKRENGTYIRKRQKKKHDQGQTQTQTREEHLELGKPG